MKKPGAVPSRPRKARGHVRGKRFTSAAMKEHEQSERWRSPYREVSLGRLGPAHRESRVMDRDNCVPACRSAAGARLPFWVGRFSCARTSPRARRAEDQDAESAGWRSFRPEANDTCVRRTLTTHAQRLWNLFGTFRIENSMIVNSRSVNNAEKQRLSWYSWVDSNHRPPDPQSGFLVVRGSSLFLIIGTNCAPTGFCATHSATPSTLTTRALEVPSRCQTTLFLPKLASVPQGLLTAEPLPYGTAPSSILASASAKEAPNRSSSSSGPVAGRL